MVCFLIVFFLILLADEIRLLRKRAFSYIATETGKHSHSLCNFLIMVRHMSVRPSRTTKILSLPGPKYSKHQHVFDFQFQDVAYLVTQI